jgi:glycosyltransferase involved in cell wall biosynthesis
MSRSAADLLGRLYGVAAEMLTIVPHGVPELPLTDPATVKPRLGMEPGPMILSFGLLGPGKGYESVIEAMPAVIAADPTAYYVILGATHPELLRRDAELSTWLTAADIFVTPYPNKDQIVSGTLAYAMSAGRACVSTRYAYAVEMLEAGRGRLVGTNSPAALSDSLTELIQDPALRLQLGQRAYDFSRTMIWSEVGARYREIFDRVVLAGRGAFVGPGVGLDIGSAEEEAVRA